MREDAGDVATREAKNYYNRQRPFSFYNEMTCNPEQQEELSTNESYPSGHTSIGWATALVLSEINPERQNEILKRGYEMGQSRVICGYHFQSNVDAGRITGSVIVARLHADPAFQAQLEKAKIDVGFAYGKVGLKDTYFEYDINDANFLRGGYFVPNWGLNSETSSSMKPSYEEPTSNEFFAANPRMLALMWEYNKGQFLTATSIFAEANVMTQKANVMKKQGWGAETRLVWRPRHVDYNVTQVGISLNYTSPNNADHNGFTFSSNFPTRVSQANCMDAIVDHANGAFKQFLLIKNL